MNDYNIILIQPDRTLPDNLVEEDIEANESNDEEERLYMKSILNKIKSINNTRICSNTEPIKLQKKNMTKNIQVDKKKIREIPKYQLESRQFNPRLPIPILKYKNKTINFNLNNNDFPTL